MAASVVGVDGVVVVAAAGAAVVAAAGTVSWVPERVEGCLARTCGL